MQTLGLVYLMGGAVCTLLYLVGIWPTFREYSRTAGLVIELFHFGIRAILVFVAWPVVAVAFCVIALSDHHFYEP